MSSKIFIQLNLDTDDMKKIKEIVTETKHSIVELKNREPNIIGYDMKLQMSY